jgi:hypothetical protein
MLNLRDRTAGVLRFLLEGIVVICTAYASVALFTWAIGQLAMARFWEPWVRQIGVLGSEIPFVLVTLTSGFAIGAAVGLAFGYRALRIAVFAGVLAAVALLVGEATYPDGTSSLWSSVTAAATLAAGLVIGGICTRRLRHA